MDRSSASSHPYDASQAGVPRHADHEHSSYTPPRNFALDVVEEPLGRQKRRRTSPEDQNILEASYRRDPKPDKAARLEIVKNVELGEKEVQIWFQNRRQSSRRKSRPLLPHEIAQYQASRSAFSSDDYPTDFRLDDTGETVHRDASSSQTIWCETRTSSGPNVTFNSQPSTSPLREAEEPALPHIAEPDVSKAAAMPQSERTHASFGRTTSQAFGDSMCSKEGEDPRESTYALPTQMQPDAVPREGPGQPAVSAHRQLKKSSSHVRLSMSFEGKASVIVKDSTSPSPQGASQSSLVGSSSNNEQVNRTSGASVPTELRPLQRSSSGRSRDSRAWEFWCDRDTRSGLEDQAARDSKGSAVDAIGLLRSASGRSILGPLSNKRNSLFSDPSSDAKRSKPAAKRPLIQRSQTSTGRLQGRSDRQTAGSMNSKPKLKYSESAVSVYVPGNDSDKENWSPATMSTAKSPRKRTALGERQSTTSTQRGPRLAPIEKAIGPGYGDENADPETDAELAAFMSGGRKSISGSSEDDLDCVQGLLSLSQGNWR